MHRGRCDRGNPHVLGRIYPEERKSAFILGERLRDVEELQQLGIYSEQLVSMHTACCVCYTSNMVVYTSIELIQ